jgi:hypothetical protein
MANSDGEATSVAIDVLSEIEFRNGAADSPSAQTSPVRQGVETEQLTGYSTRQQKYIAPNAVSSNDHLPADKCCKAICGPACE